MNYAWEQNAQNNLDISYKRKIIDMLPCLKIKSHPKNAWQNLENPLTHPSNFNVAFNYHCDKCFILVTPLSAGLTYHLILM